MIVTERFGYVIPPTDTLNEAVKTALTGGELTPEQEDALESRPPARPAGALCVCGERWRWNSHEDQEAAFMSWSAGHVDDTP